MVAVADGPGDLVEPSTVVDFWLVVFQTIVEFL